jgi:hypothetical protein
MLSLTFALFVRECSSSGGALPLGIVLAPLAQRCIHEEVAAGTEATVELFVEKGAKLEVHLTIEGPMTKAWGNVPEANEKTVKLLDEVVTNGHEEDFDDSFLFTFESKGGDNGNVYQVCVANDMNHLISKTVQLDIRTNYVPRKPETKRVKLVQNPDQLTEEERVAEKAKEEEVANLEASIKRLKAGLRKVFKQQQQERHRQAVHTAVNEDSNNHMVVGSVIETVVFIGAACFQLIFIRKWFDGKVGGRQARQWA